MADIRRIVTRHPTTGTPTTLVDFEAAGFASERDTFTVVPPAATPVLSQLGRRFGGARTVAETHANGSISIVVLVSAATHDLAMLNVSNTLKVLQAPRTDLFFQWQPEGVTNSVYYKIMGPAKYETTYSWIKWQGTKVLPIKIELPVAPLAQGAVVNYPISSTVLPNVLQMTNIPGDAPALADVSLRATGGAAFGLFGWYKHPTATPLAGSVIPIGVLEAEFAPVISGFSTSVDATYRNSNGLKATTSGAGQSNFAYTVDPSCLEPDDFSTGEIAIEVWARIQMTFSVVLPRIVLSVNDSAYIGGRSYSEFGNTGRPIVPPTSSSRFRMTRLGILNFPVDKFTPVKWDLEVTATWGSGSSGVFGIDYLVLVPAKARAASKTGVANDIAYPTFMSSGDVTKTVKGADLSGYLGSAAGNQGSDSGLGGSLIELPPGNTDLLMKLSTTVPDDPQTTNITETLGHTVTGNVRVIPRYFLAQGQ